MYREVWDADEHEHGKLTWRIRGGRIIVAIIKPKANKRKRKRSKTKIEYEQ